eukprot:372448_1
MRSALTNHFPYGKSVTNDDAGVAEAWGSYLYDYSIAEHESYITNTALKKWFPESVADSTHTARWFEEQINAGTISSVTDFFSKLESEYLGSVSPVLTAKEKAYMNETWIRDVSEKFEIANLMNVRTLTGWTTRTHTGLDVALHAYGPGEEVFTGQWTNYEIGQMLAKVFDVEDEQAAETQYLEDLFMAGTLQICDATDKLSSSYLFTEWETSIAFPEGNLLYGSGTKCVDAWLLNLYHFYMSYI